MRTAEVIEPRHATEPAGLAVEIEAGWGHSQRAFVRQDGQSLFACTVIHQAPDTWTVTECLPRRRDPQLATALLAVCERLAVDHHARQVIAIAPTMWDDDVAVRGARLLHRIEPMWLQLDDDVLALRREPLPNPLRVLPFDDGPAVAADLAGLSVDADRDSDRRVWQQIHAGDYGPVIAGASLRVVDDTGLLYAAIAVTEYQAAPLVAHLVTGAAQRGRGIGRALLVESLTRLSRLGYVDCHLNVVEDNWIAQRLYRSIGFVHCGPTLRASHISGTGLR